MTAVPTNNVQEEDYLMSDVRSSVIDAPLTLPELPKKKVPAPTVDRAVTVGGFSASTPLPVGGPTAPATVCKSVQCQAFFIAACRDSFSIHPLRPEVKTGSEVSTSLLTFLT